jgi:excisionase family DNA binding protein
MKPTGTRSPDLMRVKVAAARLGVHVRTLYRVIAQGELSLVHVRGCSCIAENDLVNYIKRNTQMRKV